MEATKKKPVEWRRRNYRQLSLKWHPDKHRHLGESAEAVAKEVFQHLQKRKDWYNDNGLEASFLQRRSTVG